MSLTTIGKVLRIMGINHEKMDSIPILSETHMQRPVFFAESMLHKGEGFHKKIFFIDEKHFNLDRPDGDRCYWHDIVRLATVNNNKFFH